LFFKANTQIGKLQGANSKELHNLIKQHQGPVEDAGEGSGSGSGSGSVPLVAGHSDITDQITLNQVDCLNQQTANPVQNALKAGDAYLESDVDEQLIIYAPFNQVRRDTVLSLRRGRGVRSRLLNALFLLVMIF